VAAVGQPDLWQERPCDRFLQVEVGEDRLRALVQLYSIAQLRGDVVQQVEHLVVRNLIVHVEVLGIFVHHIAHDFEHQREVLMHQRRGLHLAGLPLYRAPELGEELYVVLEILALGALSTGADDHAKLFGLEGLGDVPEPRAFLLVGDLLRYAHFAPAVVGEYKISARKGDAPRCAGAFEFHRSLCHLDEDFVPFLEDLADRREPVHLVAHLLPGGFLLHRVRDVDENVSFNAAVHEGRIQRWDDVLHHPHVDVAHEAVLALVHHLDQLLILDDRDTRLAPVYIDDDVCSHCCDDLLLSGPGLMRADDTPPDALVASPAPYARSRQVQVSLACAAPGAR